jgi:alpha-tubulin suppressor-like RCC1 family protein
MIFSDAFTVDQKVPILIKANNHTNGIINKISMVPSAFEFISFLNTNGELFYQGETGFDGTTRIPKRFPFEKKIILTSGNLIALSEDGKIYGIGTNTRSQIKSAFLNSRINGSTFEDISFLPTLVELSDITDDKTFFGISKQNGVVYGQGSLDTGKLGVNSSGLSFSDIYSYPFVPIKSSSEFNNSGVSQAAISARHSIFLKENSLYATGDFTGTNKYPTSEVVAVNMTILAGKTIKNIYGAHKTSIVVTQDNQIYFFGGNIFPFGGTTSPQLALVNTTIMGNQTIQDVRCGTDFCIFQTEQGNVFGSGLNSDGQLCDGSKTNPPFIVQSNLAKINGSLKQIAAGRYHTLFLTFSGLVYGAGSNNRKQRKKFILNSSSWFYKFILHRLHRTNSNDCN